MIREVCLQDADTIAEIYNHYILNSVATFETVPLSEEQMRERVSEIAEKFPYFVYESDGKVIGYCYAHPWKERVAYRYTLEAAVYLSKECTGKGVGTQLLQRLIEECRQRNFHVLVACITAENRASCALVERLGFRQVSSFEEVGWRSGRWLGVVDYQLKLNDSFGE